MYLEAAERRRKEELVAEARRLEKEQEQERGRRTDLFLTREAAIQAARLKEAKADDVLFLDSQVDPK
jgi:hypothetical protein